jgi:GNAT superfamily N-acetyltransferase
MSAAGFMIHIRDAREEDCALLTAVCLRSKAHWGYDADFMAKCVPSLTVTPGRLKLGPFRVAEAMSQIAGVASLREIEGEVSLDLFFIDPPFIGTGVGRRLFADTASLAKQLGFARLQIEADPHAEGFYTRLGAKRVGWAVSEADPQRRLPLLEFIL